MENEKAHPTEYKAYHRIATPEEMAEHKRLAEEAERNYFGSGIEEQSQVEADTGEPRRSGEGTEAEVSPSVVVIVEKPQGEDQ